MDAATTRGLWLLPTYNRATTNLPRFFRHAAATGMTTPGAVLVDERDYAAHHDDYDELELPANWSVYPVKGGCCAAATEEGLRELCDGLDWIGWASDDLIPETPGWDVKAIESLTGWNMVSTDDGLFAPKRFNGATVWSGDLVRAVGYLYPAGLKHFYIDTAWEELGRMMNIWTVRMDILVRHAHVSVGGIADSTTGRTQSFWDADEPAFIRWKNDERLAAANRIGELLVQYGVGETMPDLSDVRVMIATPCGSGRYERLYVSALFSTIETLRQCGAQVNFAEMPYCSDISLARSKIFGMFLRSDCTHLLSIDDDMGWKPQDVVRLFLYKRDFVAVAGPRKVFPPSFAVQVTDAHGNAMPLRQEGTTGLFEVSDIGLAFALLTHKVAEQVAGAHPELEYSGDDGRVEHAVFNPLVMNRRYKSEDFAFCHRWRALGGKVYVDPTISLDHVGAFVWQGDWQSHLIDLVNSQKRAA